MANIHNIWNHTRWKVFGIMLIKFICIVGFVSLFVYRILSLLDIQFDPILSSVIASIIGGLISGCILIIFDIVVIQGFEYEDIEKDRKIEYMEKRIMSRLEELEKKLDKK